MRHFYFGKLVIICYLMIIISDSILYYDAYC